MATYKSFKDAFVAMGYTPKADAKAAEKEIKCKICGGKMVRRPDSNVVVCTGTVDADGVHHDCKNYLLWNN